MALPRVYLIDSSIYIFRAWHIFDESIVSAEGFPANAVFGFGDFLYQLIRSVKPENIACAFDVSQTNSYRKELYPEYKANRDPAPEELKRQFAWCRQYCNAIGIANYGHERFEADDIIGTLASRFRSLGYAITVISADKDLAQLILGPEDRWWDFAKNQQLDPKGVEQHFGVAPSLIADMLALSGDKIDNIPGIPGVGYTTAARILRKYPSVEAITANIDNISKMKFRGAARVAALVDKNREILPLNKQLTTIYTDLTLDSKPDIRLGTLDSERWIALCSELALSEAQKQRWYRLHEDLKSHVAK